MTLLSIGNATVQFGATEIFRDVSVTIADRDRWALIGRNGAGKTTLIRLLTGELQPTLGSIARRPGMKIALLEQHRSFPPDALVWDVVADAFGELRTLEASLAEMVQRMETDHSEPLLAQYGHALERFEHEGGYEMPSRVDTVLLGLGFDPDWARTTPASVLSGGERGRLALARQIVQPADLLVLDEPTNHLDLDTTRWLEQYLRESDRTLLVVSHDRAFLETVSDHVLHMEGGTAFSYVGGYTAFIRQREERRLTQQRQFDKQQQKIASEQDYINRNLAGQNTAQAKGRRKLLARMERLSSPIGGEAVMALRLSAGDRSGDRVLETEKLALRVDGRSLLEDVTLVMPRMEIIALVGPNGAGKSTFIKTVLGERPPDGGTCKLGLSTTVAYYRQDLGHLALDSTVHDAVTTLRPFWERREVHGHLGRFGFGGDESQRVIGSLSGGERARVALALLTLSQANLLVLDEPTNHLDVESIEALEDAIDGYEGTVLLVSHDRAVLRGLATRVWELRDGKLLDFAGPFTEWEEMAERRRTDAVDAARHTRQQQAANAPPSAHETRKAQSKEERRTQREAVRAVELAEQAVVKAEADVGRLARALEAPELYDGSPAATSKAQRLGTELARARAELAKAEVAWTTASEAAEALGAL
jgi:ATP-binding cassette, subfamily F, member 3